MNGIVSADSVPTPIAGASYADPGPGFPGTTIDPRLLGNAMVGSTLKLTDGGFVGAKLSYAYQWQRCDTTGSNCGPVPGARAASYNPGMVNSSRGYRGRGVSIPSEIEERNNYETLCARFKLQPAVVHEEGTGRRRSNNGR